MTVLEALDQVYHTKSDVVRQLLRLKFQLQVVEARIREEKPEHADLLSDIADETEKIIEVMDDDQSD